MFMTQIVAEFDLIDEIEAAYRRAFANLGWKFEAGVCQPEWRHVAPIDLPNPIRRLAN